MVRKRRGERETSSKCGERGGVKEVKEEGYVDEGKRWGNGKHANEEKRKGMRVEG